MLRALADRVGRLVRTRSCLYWLPPPLAAALFLLGFAVLPVELFHDDYSLVVADRNGELLGAVLSRDEAWRFPPISEVPEKFKTALIAFEDRRFYGHPGVDFLALARALWQDISLGRIVSGGSTITMQTARLGLGAGKRGILRKGIEILVALKLTAVRSKEHVLRTFVSHAPFGGNVVGLEAASWRYFGRPPQDLSWAEAATLAVLPNAPSLITLDKNRGLLSAKRDRLLARLHESGVIDAATLALSRAEALPPRPYPLPMLAPHLVFSIKAGVFGAAGQSSVRTSLRRDLQERASSIVRRQLETLSVNGVRNASVLVLENATGRVAAYVGNTPDMDSVDGGHVDIIQQPRSTGSLLKPFLYAAMLHEGLLLPEQLVADIPTRYPGFSPENASHQYRGAVPAYMALARSLNIPAVRLLREYSVDRFYADLKSLGMTTLFRDAAGYGLPLIIGGAEGTLWDLVGMYSGLARSAAWSEAPYFAPSISADKDNTASGTAWLSPGAAYLTLEALLRVQRPGVEERWEDFSSSEAIAWKTGTSQGFRDAWAIGVTRDYTVGVWVGNADGEPRPELGGTAAAAPILFALFDVLPDSSWFLEPMHDLKTVEVCAASGWLPGPHCARTAVVKAPSSAHYAEPCPYCVTVHLDASGRWRTNTTVEEGRPIQHVSWFVLPPAMEWFYRQGNADYHALPPYKKGAEPEEGLLPLNVLYPHEGSQIYIPRELDGTLGRLIAEAVHRDTGARIFWHLDSAYLGETRDMHSMAIAAPPGEHTLTLIDENGQIVERRFTVLARG